MQLLAEREVELEGIRLKDNETLIIAGLIQETEQKSSVKIPVLGDLPFVGAAFRSSNRQSNKNELIIIVTPKIINDDEAIIERMQGPKLLDKLKKVLNVEIAQKIDKAFLKQLKFLPINEQNGVLFVACVEQTAEIEARVKDNFESQIKYIIVPEEQLIQLFDLAFLPTENQQDAQVSAKAKQDAPPRKRIGDILLEKGYVTKENLDKAFIQSQAKKEPIGSTLVRMNLLTVEQLKEALTEQQGVDAVSEKQLKFSDSLFKLFPREFLEENKHFTCFYSLSEPENSIK